MFSKKYPGVIKRTGLSAAIFLSIFYHSFSQADSSFASLTISYKDYLNLVISHNLEYTAEKFNVNIADAKIEAAKVFQNPTVEFDYGRNKEGNRENGYSLTAELSKTIETGQKRKARINFAKSEGTLVKAQLDEYLRNLLADATLDYLNALKQIYLYDVMLNSYQMMKELSGADSIRFSLGSIKAIDATQSKIEAGILMNNLLQIDADRKNAFLILSTRTSSSHTDTIFFPVGKFEKSERSFVLNELITYALNNRADLLAAKKQHHCPAQPVNLN